MSLENFQIDPFFKFTKVFPRSESFAIDPDFGKFEQEEKVEEERLEKKVDFQIDPAWEDFGRLEEPESFEIDPAWEDFGKVCEEEFINKKKLLEKELLEKKKKYHGFRSVLTSPFDYHNFSYKRTIFTRDMFNSDEEYVEAQSEYDNYKEAKSEYYKVNSEYENYLHSFSSIFASIGEESIVRDSHWKFMDDKDDKREREKEL